MRTSRTAVVCLACLALVALAGCARTERSRVILMPSGSPTTQTASLGAGDTLGWHVRGVDARIASRTAAQGSRVATGE